MDYQFLLSLIIGIRLELLYFLYILKNAFGINSFLWIFCCIVYCIIINNWQYCIDIHVFKYYIIIDILRVIVNYSEIVYNFCVVDDTF